MGPDDWWKSKCSKPVPKINLDPKKRPTANLIHFNHDLLSNRSSSIKDDNISTTQAPKTHGGAENTNTPNPVKPSEENVSIDLFKIKFP